MGTIMLAAIGAGLAFAASPAQAQDEVAVILFSHRLQDSLAVANAIQVMKRGQMAGVRPVADTTADQILGMIVTSRDPRQGRLAAAGEIKRVPESPTLPAAP